MHRNGTWEEGILEANMVTTPKLMSDVKLKLPNAQRTSRRNKQKNVHLQNSYKTTKENVCILESCNDSINIFQLTCIMKDLILR